MNNLLVDENGNILVNEDGKAYAVPKSLNDIQAKLVASYTYGLEDNGYGLSEYFTDETSSIDLKENTMFSWIFA